MYIIYKLLLFFIVVSPPLPPVVSDSIYPNGLPPEELSGKTKRQASGFQGGICVLPPYPAHGTYVVGGMDNALPGQAYTFVFLNITCYPGFVVEQERNTFYCNNGQWSDVMPKCVRLCHLPKDVSVTYHCPIADSTRGSRVCGSVVPSGTVVRPECKAPNYYYPGSLDNMVCLGGNWDYIAKCKPECGKITPEATLLVSGGKSAYKGELPWHAGIYTKTTYPYMQICGGSLVSNMVIISAAHCFWSDANKLLPASEFAVAVGKIYRPWSNPRDTDAQTSDVAEIKITKYFQGAATNYQDDIALVIVAAPFTYQVFVRPVCLDFDQDFDNQQLYDNNMGKVAGWGLVDRNGAVSQVLKVVEMPFVNVERCYARSPPSFREFITNDKICAGYTNGTALCQGDSGGGLAFPAVERGVRRYYLRGVVSTAPKNADLCSTNALTAFTRVLKHEDFIKKFLHVTSPELSSVTSSNNMCSASQWTCQDGSSCIFLDRKCDGAVDCLDGSDEIDCRQQMKPQCVLPSYPKHGSYVVAGISNAAPGQAYQSVSLTITCAPGFEVENDQSTRHCNDGIWSNEMPKCVRVCRLNKHDSVEYRCLIRGKEVQECGPRVSPGTVVKPVCRAPLYYSPGALNNMRCIDGTWDYIATCTPECGRITPKGMTLVSGGKTAYRGEVPWHAGIYLKTSNPFEYTCGGSLINTKTIITSAKCIWREISRKPQLTSSSNVQPPTVYAVAVGKIYRQWDDPGDPDAQKSDVSQISVPSRYQGFVGKYQDDIGVIIVLTPFTYQVFIRPVCINFDQNFERSQLRVGNLGRVSGWGLVSSNGDLSEQLRVVDLPLVDVFQCIRMSPPSFKEYITSDKICAGYTNETGLCRGDSGGGLAFPASDSGVLRYYLRGIVSSAPANNNLCNTRAITTFTQITKHENFIQNNMRFDD